MNTLTLLLSLTLLPPSILWAASHSYKVQQVEDGDTLIVNIGGQPVRLQLMGIDAPEDVTNPKLRRDQAQTGLSNERLLELGQKASAHLRKLIAPGSEIDVSGDLDRKDKYGRIPVIALDPNGRSLNEAMVSDGYAILLGGYPLDKARIQYFRMLEAKARDERRGLWESNLETMRAWSGGLDPQ